MFALKVGDHGFADDIIADVVGKTGGEIGEACRIFTVELIVLGDVVGVGWASGHADDVDEFESWHNSYEDAVLFVDVAGDVGVHGAAHVEG